MIIKYKQKNNRYKFMKSRNVQIKDDDDYLNIKQVYQNKNTSIDPRAKC